MTIIAVSKGTVYVDSLVGFGARKIIESKIRTCGLGKWTCSGLQNVAENVIADFIKSGAKFDSYVNQIDDREGYTCVYLKDKTGEVYSLSVYKGSTWSHLPKDSSLAEVSGSGSDFFHAYYSIYGNVEQAMELTAVHHQYCGLPIEKF